MVSRAEEPHISRKRRAVQTERASVRRVIEPSAPDDSGGIRRVLIRDVRVVPHFNCTLLSVDQLWQNSRIDTIFRDTKALQAPAAGGPGRRRALRGLESPHRRRHLLVGVLVARQLSRVAQKQHLRIKYYSVVPMNLEQIFMDLSKKQLNGEQ